MFVCSVFSIILSLHLPLPLPLMTGYIIPPFFSSGCCTCRLSVKDKLSEISLIQKKPTQPVQHVHIRYTQNLVYKNSVWWQYVIYQEFTTSKISPGFCAIVSKKCDLISTKPHDWQLYLCVSHQQVKMTFFLVCSLHKTANQAIT